MGMREDFLLSEEEKQRRKKHLPSKCSSTSESTNSSLQSLSNSKVRSETTDEIDHVSFYFSTLMSSFCG
jgi:hypothetical protein